MLYTLVPDIAVIFQQDVRRADNEVFLSSGKRHVAPPQARERSSWGKKKIVYTPGPGKERATHAGEYRPSRMVKYPQSDILKSQLFSPANEATAKSPRYDTSHAGHSRLPFGLLHNDIWIFLL